MYNRIGILDSAKVLDSSENLIKFKTHILSLESTRIQLIKHKPFCQACGDTLKYFAVEKHVDKTARRYHINAYTDNEVMLTRDHIIPKSKGGNNHLSNL